VTNPPSFRDAVSAVDRGDLNTLRAILAGDPGLIQARATGDEGDAGHYAGYFRGATLLHHVAGNPIRCPLPRADA